MVAKASPNGVVDAAKSAVATALAQPQGAASPPDLSAYPKRVFGFVGEPIALAGREYHLARLTSAGAMAARDLIESGTVPFMPDDSMGYGEALVTAAVASGNFAGFRQLLELGITEDVPPGAEYEAAPEELVHFGERLFAASGMRWFDAVLKNSAAQVTRALAQMTPVPTPPPGNSPGGTAAP